MTISARFESTCPTCNKRIAVGTSIEWTKGTKATHTDCNAPALLSYKGEQTANTPPASRRRRSGSNYTRFSSGAEVFTNRNGRCEDAPCCGCCS